MKTVLKTYGYVIKDEKVFRYIRFIYIATVNMPSIKNQIC